MSPPFSQGVWVGGGGANSYPDFASIFSFIHILNKSENATLKLYIFYEKVLDKKYLLKFNNVAQTSCKRFVETPPNCLV